MTPSEKTKLAWKPQDDSLSAINFLKEGTPDRRQF